MPPADLLTSEELRAQLERPLIIGILVVYFIHLFGAARYALPMLAPREQKRFLAAITAAFAAFVVGVVIVYGWILPWLVESYRENAMLTQFIPIALYTGGFSSQAAWMCFGAGALCEIPILTLVLGRFGFQPLQKRAAGYALILVLSASIPPTTAPLPFAGIAVSSIVFYEMSLGILQWMGFRGRPDEEHYSY